MPRTEKQNEEIRAQSRRGILDAAFRLFAQHGFNKTSMASIASEAGVSKGLIYHHFNSKEEVLLAIFDNLMQMGDEIMSLTPDSGDPKTVLESMIDLSVRFMHENKEWARLMVHLALQEDVIAGLSDHIEAIRSGRLEQVRPLFEALGYKEPIDEAYYFGAKMDGIMMGLLSIGDDYPLDMMVKRIKSEYKLNTD